ncbi:MAG: GAF domain-containing protein, partial [Anaerolineae bacterium]|nr:GAF domain-containing protein [Anaerolineae bacterium]
MAANEKLRHGQFDTGNLPVPPRDAAQRLADNLKALATALEIGLHATPAPSPMTAHIGGGVLLDEILDRVYVEFQDFLPYDRMGVSVVDVAAGTVTAIWARTSVPRQRIRKGYTAHLDGSSLQAVLASGEPRIIDDLQHYLKQHPDSYSTKLALSEGIRSSMTCPLMANGVPIGFVFFSSAQPHTYTEAHIALYRQVSTVLATVISQGLANSEQTRQYAHLQRVNALLHDLRDGLAR